MSVIIPDGACFVKSIDEDSTMFFAMPSSIAGSDNLSIAGSDNLSTAGSDNLSTAAAANDLFPGSLTILCSVACFRAVSQSYLSKKTHRSQPFGQPRRVNWNVEGRYCTYRSRQSAAIAALQTVACIPQGGVS